MRSIHIHIQGQVQGVGFRPTVYRLANNYNLNGWVSNGLDGVHIEVEGPAHAISGFVQELKTDPPSRARIISINIKESDPKDLTGFSIRESEKTGTGQTLITPDLGICENCRNEIHDPNDRRYQYDFTTCTHCGPRYSIIRSMPYDRETTTMDIFPMCPVCTTEYGDISNRRYYSQTNSCPACGIQLRLLDNTGRTIETENTTSFQRTVDLLEKGNILAVKGIGGFLLICDACNEEAVSRLRSRKLRPTKPFALLYPSIELLQKDAFVDPQEAAAITSIESPIVLVRRKPNPASGLCTNVIAPGLDKIGVMKGYTPLFDRLSRTLNRPLVATSGNITGSPISFEDSDAIKMLGSIADFFLTNNREILVPQDDSVMYFSEKNKTPVVLRRSRGLAPTFIPDFTFDPSIRILATGGQLKSSFSLTHAGNLYISQYLGKLDNLENSQRMDLLIDHFARMLSFNPQLIISDLHPDYEAALIGEDLSAKHGIPHLRVQHHKAHAYAILGEHNLLNTTKPVLSIVFDGTGLGEDHGIWGGEAFIYSDHTLKRIDHIPYFNNFLGDKMAKEPRISAFSLFHHLPDAARILAPKFSEREWKLYNNHIKRNRHLPTSSVGRLFDGVASMLGLCDYNEYEGRAALILQQEASGAWRKTGRLPESYPLPHGAIDRMIQSILNDITNKVEPGIIALKFHITLVDWILSLSVKRGCQRIAFSGGVFQNGLLIDLIQEKADSGMELFFHKNLSANDENISFGQLVYGLEHYKRVRSGNTKFENAI